MQHLGCLAIVEIVEASPKGFSIERDGTSRWVGRAVQETRGVLTKSLLDRRRINTRVAKLRREIAEAEVARLAEEAEKARQEAESAQSEVTDLAKTTGLMLAMLLGIPVLAQARAVQPNADTEERRAGEPDVVLAQQTCSDRRADDPSRQEPVPLADSCANGSPADGDPALAPLPLRRSARYTAASLIYPKCAVRN